MISQIVVGQRVNKSTQTRFLDDRPNRLDMPLLEMNFELRNWMRAKGSFGHLAGEQYPRIFRESCSKPIGGAALVGREIDMGVIGRVFSVGHAVVAKL